MANSQRYQYRIIKEMIIQTNQIYPLFSNLETPCAYNSYKQVEKPLSTNICQVSLVIGKLLGHSIWYLDEAGVIPGLTERRKEDK